MSRLHKKQPNLIRLLTTRNVSGEQPRINNAAHYRLKTHSSHIWTNPLDSTDTKVMKIQQAFLPAQHPKRQNKIAKKTARLVYQQLTAKHMSKQAKAKAMRMLAGEIKSVAAKLNEATIPELAHKTPNQLAHRLTVGELAN